jgi:hypothetical protein
LAYVQHCTTIAPSSHRSSGAQIGDNSMTAETTSPVGTHIARVQGRLSNASCRREASGGAALRHDSTDFPALIANAAP